MASIDTSQSGIVVSTAIAGGAAGGSLNHGEGIVVSTPLIAGGVTVNHAEGVVVATAVTAGRDGITVNHSEGTVPPQR